MGGWVGGLEGGDGEGEREGHILSEVCGQRDCIGIIVALLMSVSLTTTVYITIVRSNNLFFKITLCH